MTHNESYAGFSRELSPQALNKAMLEAVDFIHAQGWDTPPTLFGLVPTTIIQQHLTPTPDGTPLVDDAPLTLVIQELPCDLPADPNDIGGYLSSITWPPEVMGAIMAQTIQFQDAATPEADSQPALLVSGVLRSEAELTLLQLPPRAGTSERGELRGGSNIAPGVIAALRATFE